jgi:hypothetical protein
MPHGPAGRALQENQTPTHRQRLYFGQFRRKSVMTRIAIQARPCKRLSERKTIFHSLTSGLLGRLDEKAL